MRICIDIDGVLRNWGRAVVDEFWRQHPEYMLSDTIPDWDMTNIDIHQKIKMKRIFETWVDFIYPKMIPLRDAVYAFEKLRKWADKNGHELVCITDQPNDTVAGYTLHWLAQYRFIFTEIHILRNGKQKCDFNVDILVDDAPTHYAEWIACRHPDTFIMMDAKYNRCCDAQYRITSLLEVPKIIDGMKVDVVL